MPNVCEHLTDNEDGVTRKRCTRYGEWRAEKDGKFIFCTIHKPDGAEAWGNLYQQRKEKKALKQAAAPASQVVPELMNTMDEDEEEQQVPNATVVLKREKKPGCAHEVAVVDHRPQTPAECNNFYMDVKSYNTPIDTKYLKRVPGIVAKYDPWYYKTLESMQQIVDAVPRGQSIATLKDDGLDLSASGPNRVRADAFGPKIVKDYEVVHNLADDFAELVHHSLNRGPTLGGMAAGHITKPHYHISGVLFMNAGENEQCVKKFKLAYSNLKESKGKASVTVIGDFDVLPGEVLWLPPFTQHEVFTIGGALVKGGNLQALACRHWIAWCMPVHLLNDTILQFQLGLRDEQQAREGAASCDAAKVRRMYALGAAVRADDDARPPALPRMQAVMKVERRQGKAKRVE